MRTLHYPNRDTWAALSTRPAIDLEFLESAVRNILNRVKAAGDEALIELTYQHDKVKLNTIMVSEEEVNDGVANTPILLKKAIDVAAANIEKFHALHFVETAQVETQPGVLCWRKGIPIEKVGIYIPGGSAPLFSTILMLGIPAKLAGCKEVILCTPPPPDGTIDPSILYTARKVGITQIFKVGGAQAIAAMAYGTSSVPAVYKIFGPGNQYVTKAKQMVNQDGIAIDLPAGPSEVMVVADEGADVSFVAADLLSQAEHGPDSQVLLLTTSLEFIEKLPEEMERQLHALPRQQIARKALNNSLAILLATEHEILDFINEYAPEHLILNTENCDALAPEIRNAGSVFLGPFTPEAAGDYASGTNHTLPTNGFAKAYSGVSVESFMKYITFQKISPRGIKELGPHIEVMAKAEQLEGHRHAIRVRIDQVQ